MPPKNPRRCTMAGLGGAIGGLLGGVPVGLAIGPPIAAVVAPGRADFLATASLIGALLCSLIGAVSGALLAYGSASACDDPGDGGGGSGGHGSPTTVGNTQAVVTWVIILMAVLSSFSPGFHVPQRIHPIAAIIPVPMFVPLPFLLWMIGVTWQVVAASWALRVRAWVRPPVYSMRGVPAGI